LGKGGVDKFVFLTYNKTFFENLNLQQTERKMNANGNVKTKDPLLERVGAYDIIDVIGEGGMGKVYKAFDPTLRRWVAIKVLAPEFRGISEIAGRFHQEAEVASRLVHPNVLSIIQYGYDKKEELLYIVTELLVGEDLESVLQTGQLLPLERIRRIMNQVLSALAAAHRFGIVHRDLKPGNVFLMEDPPDFVKILDFGLAKIIGDVAGASRNQEMTQEGKVFGTPKYMSPEQVTAKKIDHRTDIYSAGVILYEMITGKPPFSGETSQETMYMHVRDGVKSPLELRKDCPSVLGRVVLKALEKEPDNRFASARAFRDALEEAFEKPERVSIVGSITTSIGKVFGLGKKPQAEQAPSPPGVPNSDPSAISTEFAPTISASSMPSAEGKKAEEKTEKKQPEAEPAKEAEDEAKPAPKPRTLKKFWYGVAGVVAAVVLLTVGVGYFLLLSKERPVVIKPGVATTLTPESISKPMTFKPATPAEKWKICFETGLALEKEKRWKEAEAEYQKSAELAPDQSDVWKKLGEVRLKQPGKKAEAAKAYREYLKLKPDAPDAPYIEGLIENW
jgi:serine/threonine protein kinase